MNGRASDRSILTTTDTNLPAMQIKKTLDQHMDVVTNPANDPIIRDIEGERFNSYFDFIEKGNRQEPNPLIKTNNNYSKKPKAKINEERVIQKRKKVSFKWSLNEEIPKNNNENKSSIILVKKPDQVFDDQYLYHPDVGEGHTRPRGEKVESEHPDAHVAINLDSEKRHLMECMEGAEIGQSDNALSKSGRTISYSKGKRLTCECNDKGNESNPLGVEEVKESQKKALFSEKNGERRNPILININTTDNDSRGHKGVDSQASSAPRKTTLGLKKPQDDGDKLAPRDSAYGCQIVQDDDILSKVEIEFDEKISPRRSPSVLVECITLHRGCDEDMKGLNGQCKQIDNSQFQGAQLSTSNKNDDTLSKETKTFSPKEPDKICHDDPAKNHFDYSVFEYRRDDVIPDYRYYNKHPQLDEYRNLQQINDTRQSNMRKEGLCEDCIDVKATSKKPMEVARSEPVPSDIALIKNVEFEQSPKVTRIKVVNADSNEFQKKPAPNVYAPLEGGNSMFVTNKIYPDLSSTTKEGLQKKGPMLKVVNADSNEVLKVDVSNDAKKITYRKTDMVNEGTSTKKVLEDTKPKERSKVQSPSKINDKDNDLKKSPTLKFVSTNGSQPQPNDYAHKIQATGKLPDEASRTNVQFTNGVMSENVGKSRDPKVDNMDKGTWGKKAVNPKYQPVNNILTETVSADPDTKVYMFEKDKNSKNLEGPKVTAVKNIVTENVYADRDKTVCLFEKDKQPKDSVRPKETPFKSFVMENVLTDQDMTFDSMGSKDRFQGAQTNDFSHRNFVMDRCPELKPSKVIRCERDYESSILPGRSGREFKGREAYPTHENRHYDTIPCFTDHYNISRVEDKVPIDTYNLYPQCLPTNRQVVDNRPAASRTHLPEPIPICCNDKQQDKICPSVNMDSSCPHPPPNQAYCLYPRSNKLVDNMYEKKPGLSKVDFKDCCNKEMANRSKTPCDLEDALHPGEYLRALDSYSLSHMFPKSIPDPSLNLYPTTEINCRPTYEKRPSLRESGVIDFYDQPRRGGQRDYGRYVATVGTEKHLITIDKYSLTQKTEDKQNAIGDIYSYPDPKIREMFPIVKDHENTDNYIKDPTIKTYVTKIHKQLQLGGDVQNIDPYSVVENNPKPKRHHIFESRPHDAHLRSHINYKYPNTLIPLNDQITERYNIKSPTENYGQYIYEKRPFDIGNMSMDMPYIPQKVDHASLKGPSKNVESTAKIDRNNAGNKLERPKDPTSRAADNVDAKKTTETNGYKGPVPDVAKKGRLTIAPMEKSILDRDDGDIIPNKCEDNQRPEPVISSFQEKEPRPERKKEAPKNTMDASNIAPPTFSLFPLMKGSDRRKKRRTSVEAKLKSQYKETKKGVKSSEEPVKVENENLGKPFDKKFVDSSNDPKAVDRGISNRSTMIAVDVYRGKHSKSPKDREDKGREFSKGVRHHQEEELNDAVDSSTDPKAVDRGISNRSTAVVDDQKKVLNVNIDNKSRRMREDGSKHKGTKAVKVDINLPQMLKVVSKKKPDDEQRPNELVDFEEKNFYQPSNERRVNEQRRTERADYEEKNFDQPTNERRIHAQRRTEGDDCEKKGFYQPSNERRVHAQRQTERADYEELNFDKPLNERMIHAQRRTERDDCEEKSFYPPSNERRVHEQRRTVKADYEEKNFDKPLNERRKHAQRRTKRDDCEEKGFYQPSIERRFQEKRRNKIDDFEENGFGQAPYERVQEQRRNKINDCQEKGFVLAPNESRIQKQRRNERDDCEEKGLDQPSIETWVQEQRRYKIDDCEEKGFGHAPNKRRVIEQRRNKLDDCEEECFGQAPNERRVHAQRRTERDDCEEKGLDQPSIERNFQKQRRNKIDNCEENGLDQPLNERRVEEELRNKIDDCEEKGFGQDPNERRVHAQRRTARDDCEEKGFYQPSIEKRVQEKIRNKIDDCEEKRFGQAPNEGRVQNQRRTDRDDCEEIGLDQSLNEGRVQEQRRNKIDECEEKGFGQAPNERKVQKQRRNKIDDCEEKGLDQPLNERRVQEQRRNKIDDGEQNGFAQPPNKRRVQEQQRKEIVDFEEKCFDAPPIERRVKQQRSTEGVHYKQENFDEPSNERRVHEKRKNKILDCEEKGFDQHLNERRILEQEQKEIVDFDPRCYERRVKEQRRSERVDCQENGFDQPPNKTRVSEQLQNKIVDFEEKGFDQPPNEKMVNEQRRQEIVDFEEKCFEAPVNGRRVKEQRRTGKVGFEEMSFDQSPNERRKKEQRRKEAVDCKENGFDQSTNEERKQLRKEIVNSEENSYDPLPNEIRVKERKRTERVDYKKRAVDQPSNDRMVQELRRNEIVDCEEEGFDQPANERRAYERRTNKKLDCEEKSFDHSLNERKLHEPRRTERVYCDDMGFGQITNEKMFHEQRGTERGNIEEKGFDRHPNERRVDEQRRKEIVYCEEKSFDPTHNKRRDKEQKTSVRVNCQEKGFYKSPNERRVHEQRRKEINECDENGFDQHSNERNVHEELQNEIDNCEEKGFDKSPKERRDHEQRRKEKNDCEENDFNQPQNERKVYEQRRTEIVICEDKGFSRIPNVRRVQEERRHERVDFEEKGFDQPSNERRVNEQPRVEKVDCEEKGFKQFPNERRAHAQRQNKIVDCEEKDYDPPSNESRFREQRRNERVDDQEKRFDQPSNKQRTHGQRQNKIIDSEEKDIEQPLNEEMIQEQHQKEIVDCEEKNFDQTINKKMVNEQRRNDGVVGQEKCFDQPLNERRVQEPRQNKIADFEEQDFDQPSNKIMVHEQLRNERIRGQEKGFNLPLNEKKVLEKRRTERVDGHEKSFDQLPNERKVNEQRQKELVDCEKKSFDQPPNERRVHDQRRNERVDGHEKSFDQLPDERKVKEQRQKELVDCEKKSFDQPPNERRVHDQRRNERVDGQEKSFNQLPNERKAKEQRQKELVDYEKKRFDQPPNERRVLERRRNKRDDCEEKGFGQAPNERRVYEKQPNQEMVYDKTSNERKVYDKPLNERRIYEERPDEGRIFDSPPNEKTINEKPPNERKRLEQHLDQGKRNEPIKEEPIEPQRREKKNNFVYEKQSNEVVQKNPPNILQGGPPKKYWKKTKHEPDEPEAFAQNWYKLPPCPLEGGSKVMESEPKKALPKDNVKEKKPKLERVKTVEEVAIVPETYHINPAPKSFGRHVYEKPPVVVDPFYDDYHKKRRPSCNGISKGQQLLDIEAEVDYITDVKTDCITPEAYQLHPPTRASGRHCYEQNPAVIDSNYGDYRCKSIQKRPCSPTSSSSSSSCSENEDDDKNEKEEYEEDSCEDSPVITTQETRHVTEVIITKCRKCKKRKLMKRKSSSSESTESETKQSDKVTQTVNVRGKIHIEYEFPRSQESAEEARVGSSQWNMEDEAFRRIYAAILDYLLIHYVDILLSCYHIRWRPKTCRNACRSCCVPMSGDGFDRVSCNQCCRSLPKEMYDRHIRCCALKQRKLRMGPCETGGPCQTLPVICGCYPPKGRSDACPDKPEPRPIKKPKKETCPQSRNIEIRHSRRQQHYLINDNTKSKETGMMNRLDIRL